MPCGSKKVMSNKKKTPIKGKGLKKLSEFYKTALGTQVSGAPQPSMGTAGNPGAPAGAPNVQQAPAMPQMTMPAQQPALGSSLKSIKPLASR
jgi:hypothetical protein